MTQWPLCAHNIPSQRRQRLQHNEGATPAGRAGVGRYNRSTAGAAAVPCDSRPHLRRHGRRVLLRERSVHLFIGGTWRPHAGPTEVPAQMPKRKSRRCGSPGADDRHTYISVHTYAYMYIYMLHLLLPAGCLCRSLVPPLRRPRRLALVRPGRSHICAGTRPHLRRDPIACRPMSP